MKLIIMKIRPLIIINKIIMWVINNKVNKIKKMMIILIAPKNLLN